MDRRRDALRHSRPSHDHATIVEIDQERHGEVRPDEEEHDDQHRLDRVAGLVQRRAGNDRHDLRIGDGQAERRALQDVEVLADERRHQDPQRLRHASRGKAPGTGSSRGPLPPRPALGHGQHSAADHVGDEGGGVDRKPDPQRTSSGATWTPPRKLKPRRTGVSICSAPPMQRRPDQPAPTAISKPPASRRLPAPSGAAGRPRRSRPARQIQAASVGRDTQAGHRGRIGEDRGNEQTADVEENRRRRATGCRAPRAGPAGSPCRRTGSAGAAACCGSVP